MELPHPVLNALGFSKGPNILNLSPVQFNCHCCQAIYCPIGRCVADGSRRCQHMPTALLSRVMSGILEFPEPPVLRILPHGELAQYNYIDFLTEQVRLLSGRIPIVANTNGVFLERLESLLPYLTILEVSLNAVNQEEYAALRKGARPTDFQKIEGQLNELAERIRKHELSTKILVSFLRYPGVNDLSWPTFEERWAERGLEPILRDLHSFSNHVDSKIRKKSFEKLPPCRSIYTRMTITTEGNFIRCYNDIDSTDVIGHIRSGKSLVDLWYSEENIRGILVMFDQAQGLTFCSHCRDRVCADPARGVGRGLSFEEHAYRHHRQICKERRPICDEGIS